MQRLDSEFAIESIAAQHEFDPLDHSFTHFKLTMKPLRVDAKKLRIRAQAPGTMWLDLADIETAALPKPVKTILQRLL